jgi:hypothetical protein
MELWSPGIQKKMGYRTEIVLFENTIKYLNGPCMFYTHTLSHWAVVIYSCEKINIFNASQLLVFQLLTFTLLYFFKLIQIIWS